MQIRNTEQRYGVLTIILHWLMAFLIMGLLGLGLYMVRLPGGDEKSMFYGWHKEFGVLVLGLVSLRLLWRLSSVLPRLDIPTLEKIATRTVHRSFYLLMIAMPITGWFMSSAAGHPPSFFGLFVLPNLMAANDEWRHFFSEVHEYLAYVLMVLIILHGAAALKHHFINKDDILIRMIR